MLPTYPRHPFRPVPLTQREIKHIHYQAMKQSAITAFGREKSSDIRWHRVIENQAIKQTVDNISGSPGHYKREADDVTCLSLSTVVNAGDVVDEETDRDNTDQGKKQFAANLPSECHAVVLDKDELKPGEYRFRFSEIEMSLNPVLDTWSMTKTAKMMMVASHPLLIFMDFTIRNATIGFLNKITQPYVNTNLAAKCTHHAPLR